MLVGFTKTTSSIITRKLKFLGTFLQSNMTVEVCSVSSFTAVGHLLHVNLKEDQLPFKSQIGEDLLKKNKRALAVVNKVISIENEFRYFPLEIIAKREDCDKTDEELMVVEVNENTCRYQFDFTKVYWNSRLSTEHERMINLFKPNCDIVFDLCAGVGPFAVPAAKKKCYVYANDLNPDSIKWLTVNVKRNKIKPEYMQIFLKDAKEFIIEDMKEKLIGEYERVEREELATMPTIHILMNLPAIALTFLPYLHGIFKESRDMKVAGDMSLLELYRKQSLDHFVYCYCFLKGAFEDPSSEVRKMAETSFGRPLLDNSINEIFRVRNVAPYKEMYRIKFKLDESNLFT